MYLSNVQGSKTAKFVAILTLFAVIISLLPVSAFAEEAEPTEPEIADVAGNTDTSDNTEDATESTEQPADETPADETVTDDTEEGVVEGVMSAARGFWHPKDKPTICHANRDQANGPFTLIENADVDGDNWFDNFSRGHRDGHGDHENDIIPATDEFPNGQNLGLFNEYGVTGQDILDNDCEVPEYEGLTIVAHKLVCTNESDLPNWGAGGPDITDTTAADWVAEHDSCSFKQGWEFEWAPEGTGESSGTLVGPAGGNWTTFGPTDATGMTSTTLDLADVTGLDYIWFREVLQEGYIGFTHDKAADNPNADDVTAEVYCGYDVKNYDNYDNIGDLSSGNTVNCVAWNVLADDDNGDDTKTIDGYKFNDKNGNGIWDTETENGIEGWEIMLTQGDSDPLYATTDADGYYSFEVEDGSYVVSETQQKGWEQTATIGENVDGDRCYINVGEVVAAKTAIVDNEIAVDYNDTCIFGNKEIIVAPVCETGNNLLVNGSFEDPEVEGDWSIFSTVAGWTIALSDGLELWANGFYGGASEGNQNAELDGNAPTKITQNVTTVPGATYELRFDFSARPDADSAADNNVDGLVNGAAIMNATANGSDITENTWSTHSETFVAATATTEIGFEDKGTNNSYGSLIDNAVLCLVDMPDNGGGNDTPKRNGGGSGTRVKRAPAGEVLGASVSTPTGQVLGDATSTLPVGAPNTGAGGTSPVVVQLPTIVAVLPKSEKIK